MSSTNRATAGWQITHAHELLCGEYSLELELELGGGECELAMVELVSRATSADPYAYPAVCVVSCTSDAARDWLEADESVREVYSACERGVRGAA